MEFGGWAGASEMKEKNVSSGKQHREAMERGMILEVESGDLGIPRDFLWVLDFTVPEGKTGSSCRASCAAVRAGFCPVVRTSIGERPY